MKKERVFRASSALAVQRVKPNKFYQLTIGSEELGWVIISDDSWPQQTDPAFEALFDAIKDLVDLDNPEVNSILKSHSIRFQLPTRSTEYEERNQ